MFNKFHENILNIGLDNRKKKNGIEDENVLVSVESVDTFRDNISDNKWSELSYSTLVLNKPITLEMDKYDYTFAGCFYMNSKFTGNYARVFQLTSSTTSNGWDNFISLYRQSPNNYCMFSVRTNNGKTENGITTTNVADMDCNFLIEYDHLSGLWKVYIENQLQGSGTLKFGTVTFDYFSLGKSSAANDGLFYGKIYNFTLSKQS